jgi:hypothetical protein
VKALDCIVSINEVPICFNILAGGDGTATALAQCLQGTGSNCCAGDAGYGCFPGGGGSSAGNGQCSSNTYETCNGIDYTVVCNCPQAKCVCFGNTTTVVDYPYCPYCGSSGPGEMGPTDSQIISLCAFPR